MPAPRLVLALGVGSLALSIAIGSAACGKSSSDGVAAGDGDAAAGGDGASGEAGTNTTSNVTLMSLPIGDGKYGAAPKVGYVFSCQSNFMTGIGGAFADGPWIHKDTGTFDFTAKIAVQGAVAWPAHTFTMTVSAGTRTVAGNGLPDHDTGTFPIGASDPAYAYDRNPSSIKQAAKSWALPATPTVAATESCLGGGPIGILLTGAAFFDALDGEGRDAVAHEVQDACQAHPEMSGTYHYHSLTTCIADPGTAHSALLGYARDGFGIYGVRGEDGKTLTNADLDACHGHTHTIMWDGAAVSLYHYHATYEYPYTLGCFKGTPIKG